MASDDHTPQHPSDADDEAALETLFREHFASLTDFAARYLGDRESAEEVVQDVFLEVWTRRNRTRFRTSARAYLYRSVRNRALNRLDRRRVAGRFRRLLAATEPVPSAPPVDPAAGLDVDPLHRALGAVVGALPPRTRLAVTLRYYHGLSHRDTAAAMGISVKGVERLLGLALTKLRAALGAADVGEPSPRLSDGS